jgi:uncharacterized protein (TIGR03067 family)
VWIIRNLPLNESVQGDEQEARLHSEFAKFKQACLFLFLSILVFITATLCEPWIMRQWHGAARKLNPDDHRDIQGTWVVVMAEDRGKPEPITKGTISFVFEGDELKFRSPTGQVASAGSFVLDPARKAIDLSRIEAGASKGAGETCAGLYELSAERLVLCVALPGRARPKDFESTSRNFHTLMILERQ